MRQWHHSFADLFREQVGYTISKFILVFFVLDKSSALLSPVSLVVLIGCVFVLIAGIATLLGFIIHKKREQRLLQSDTHNPSNSSVWLSDVTGGLARTGVSYWAEDNPLDITFSSTTDLRRQDNNYQGFPSSNNVSYFRRLKDQRRRSFHVTSVPQDSACSYPEPLETYPMHHIRSSPCGDGIGLSNSTSFTCPGFKSRSIWCRLPRYGTTSNEDSETHNTVVHCRNNDGFYTGTSAYP